MVEVPTFVSGEPGFTVKLNELGDVLRQLVEDNKALQAKVEKLESKPKTAPRSTARKTSATS